MRRTHPQPVVMFALAAVITAIFQSASHPVGSIGTAQAQEQPAPAAGKVGKFPHVEFDIAKRQVRVECEALAVNAPLEFFICLAGTAEHEAVMRTSAKPSHIHTAMLAVGLKPGQPMTFLDATKKWLPRRVRHCR